MQDNITVISTDQLRSIVDETVQAALAKSLPPAIRQASEGPFLSKEELMRMTGWSSRTVEYRKAQGDIPFIRRNRTVLFPRDEIMAWLQQGLVPVRKEAK